ncbi:MAG: glycosyltransferase [Clostridia bacterium]|nr:glycosyltransferase [Clostridia bacterium]
MGFNWNGLSWMTGSTDATKALIESFIEKNTNSSLEIKYFYQENQGKMTALNNLISNASSDLLIECDSDDYLKNNAIKIINSKYEGIKDKENIYALAFLKYDQNLCNIGSTFKNDNYETNMFNLYFKDGLTGDKSLVFVTKIRKQYSYKLEKHEKFSTEARLYNEMDKKYNVICFNYPIMICEYLKEGYSQNIAKIFIENPYGYYEYFRQILNFDMKDVLFSKRLYVIKHYILFSYLTKNKNILKNIKGTFNKFLVVVLYVPGVVKSWLYKKSA